MPANPKYLTKSPWQRFAKISAGFLGGYILAHALHLALAVWFDKVNVLITSTFSLFIVWMVLFLVAFLAKNGWKVWIYYLVATLLLSIFIYLGNAP